jgi:hypothetical protein
MKEHFDYNRALFEYLKNPQAEATFAMLAPSALFIVQFK